MFIALLQIRQWTLIVKKCMLKKKDQSVLRVKRIKVMKRKHLWIGSILIFMFCIFCMISNGNIYAAQKRTVKVAFFPMDGYHIINPDGSHGGMDVEYMNALCEYTSWNAEYISCDSWEEALQMLSDKKADLKMNSPELETELMNQFYYSKFDKTALLTIGENQYLADKKKLVVGYLDGFYPFSYEEDGEFKGLTRQLLESGLHVTGLELKNVFRSEYSIAMVIRSEDEELGGGGKENFSD